MYQFLPPADITGKEANYAFWENGFSNEDLDRIISYGDKKIELEGMIAKVGENTEDPSKRRTTVAWVPQNEETIWLYDKMAFIARQLNGQFFQFDLTGFQEQFQYGVYNGLSQGHYDWHTDKGYTDNNSTQPPRKLSMVLQLSDPKDYEGGELELNQVGNVRKDRGVVHVFPSWVMHRVTPVTKGVRKSIVVWSCGPKFR